MGIKTCLGKLAGNNHTRERIDTHTLTHTLFHKFIFAYVSIGLNTHLYVKKKQFISEQNN